MRKYFFTVSISILIVILASCSSESSSVKNYGKIKLRFEETNNYSSREGDSIVSFKDIEVYIKSLEPFKLESEEIEELLAKDSITNIETYGYVLKEMNRWGTKIGYFFDNNSGCMVYGTMYYGDNGVNLFVAASVSTRLLFSDICPPAGSAWAKTKK